MYYFKTENMKKAEDKLLKECKSSGVCPRSVQKASNAKDLYIISKLLIVSIIVDYNCYFFAIIAIKTVMPQH